MCPLPQLFLKTTKAKLHHPTDEIALISKVINICQKGKDTMLVGENPKMILTGRSESARPIAPILKYFVRIFYQHLQNVRNETTEMLHLANASVS